MNTIRKINPHVPAALRHFTAALMLALALAGCKKPTLPNSITSSDAAAIAANTADEVRDVDFGNCFVLLGAAITPADDRLQIEFAWKSTAKQQLHWLVPIHIVNAKGDILAQADYKQSPEGAAVVPGMMWRDIVQIPVAQLKGATALAIGLMGAGEKWLPADRGQRDWENRRLLIPLPENIPQPSPPSPFEGFIEGLNEKFIGGWVWNKEQPDAPVEVEIFDSEQLLVKIAANGFRDDLLKNKKGDGKHGFQLPTPEKLKDGAKHVVHIRVAGTKVALKGSPAVFPPPAK